MKLYEKVGAVFEAANNAQQIQDQLLFTFNNCWFFCYQKVMTGTTQHVIFKRFIRKSVDFHFLKWEQN